VSTKVVSTEDRLRADGSEESTTVIDNWIDADGEKDSATTLSECERRSRRTIEARSEENNSRFREQA